MTNDRAEVMIDEALAVTKIIIGQLPKLIEDTGTSSRERPMVLGMVLLMLSAKGQAMWPALGHRLTFEQAVMPLVEMEAKELLAHLKGERDA